MNMLRFYCFGIMIIAVLIICGSRNTEARAQPSDCRTAALPDGAPALFCKDKSGKWKQQAGEVVTAPFSGGGATAVSERGTVTYRGTFSASVARKQRQPSNLNLDNLLKQAMNANANATKYEGALTMVTTFDGAAVTAKLSGTGGMTTSTFTGLVRGGICRLTDPQNIEVYEGPCTRTRFSGTIKSTANNRNNTSGTFDAQASDYVDLSVRDARRAELQKLCDSGRSSACVELDQMK
jgi:hypothetical protein